MVGLLTCAVMGVVTTYAVSWRLMNRLESSTMVPIGTYVHLVDGGIWRYDVFGGRGTEWVIARSESSISFSDDRPASGRVGTPPSWSLVRRESPQRIAARCGAASQKPILVFERRAGWPRSGVVDRRFHSVPFNAGYDSIPGKSYSVKFQASKGFGLPSDGVTLAFMPLWPGFAVDAALFGSAWAALLGLVMLAWRRMRAREGRCRKCRYDLKGLREAVCPECGEAVKPGRLVEA